MAEASREFDVYMKETLGATDADLARREDIRLDSFDRSSKTPRARSVRSRDKYPRRRNAKDPESDEPDFSATDDDDDDDDDDDEEDIYGERTNKERSDITSSKIGKRASAAGASKEDNEAKTSRVTDDDYEEFLKFKEMKEKRRK